MATRVSSPLFIGRKAELGTLTDALDRAADRSATTLLVGGDAGIGKSRIVAEIEGRARDRGFLVLEGGCISLGDGGGLPFAPIIEALRRLPALLAEGTDGAFGQLDDHRSAATSELGRLVPELGSTTAGPEHGAFDRPEWIQGRIFEGLLALLQSLGERAPVLLVLEDLHWADGSTRDVITFLARNARTERLAVIGTYRTDELHRRHPLRPWLSEMERLPRVERLELSRFGRTDLAAQVAAILEHAPGPGLLDAVERRAEGNPFFVEELLASGAGESGEGIPETLRDVLLSRVTALSEDAQRVLGVASVAGRGVASDLLAEVAQVAEAEIEAPVREAVASQIFVTDPGSQAHAYRFRHALLAEAVYDDLLPSERRRLHAAYAEALERRPVPESADGASHLAALAHHATEAHEPARALRAWVNAARLSSGAYGFAESLTAYERAITLWDAVPADDRPPGVDPAALYDEASLAAMISGRPDRAVDFARMATALMDRVREPERWAAANVRLSRALWVSGSMQDGLAILHETAAALKDMAPSPTRARVAAALAGALMLRGEHSQAIPAANAAIELARTAGSAVSEAHAMATLGTSTVLIGQTEEGLRILRDAFDRTQALENAYDDVGRSYANLTSALLIAGRPEESLAKAVEGVAWAKSVGAWRGYGRFVTGNAMDAAVALGRWQDAEGWMDELLAHDAVGVNRMGMIAAGGTFLAQRGRLELAAGLLTEGRRLVEPLQEAQFTAPVYVGLVELALTQGHLDEACAAAAEGVERLLRTEDRHYLADLLVAGSRAEADLAEMLRARKDTAGAARASARAGTYADRLESMARSVAQPEAFGGQLAADLAVGLAEAARAAGSDAVDLWSAATSQARRKGPWMEAYTRYRLGEALLSAHAPRREAEAALAHAYTIAQGLSAQPLMGWIEGTARRGRISLTPEEPAVEPPAVGPSSDGDALGLTSREREVLALVAEGYTNRRIAETLFISESTAGVHVSNILGKLGVATRTEAATMATRLGLIRTEVAAER